MVAPIPHRENVKKTGKIRYRLSWRKKLILQIEESYNLATWVNCKLWDKQYTAWRDATMEDITDKVAIL